MWRVTLLRGAFVRGAYLQGINCQGASIPGAYCQGAFIRVAFVGGLLTQKPIYTSCDHNNYAVYPKDLLSLHKSDNVFNIALFIAMFIDVSDTKFFAFTDSSDSLCMYVTAILQNQLFPGIPNPFRESGESLKRIEIPRNL